MDELQQNRYDMLLRRVGGLIGPGSKVTSVIAELFPMIDVENVPGELLILMGTRIVFGGGTVTGAAGQSPKVQLFNPVDSGHLVTITRLSIAANASTIVRWGVVNVALTTGVGTETFRDMRLPLTARPIGEMRQESAVALADGTNQTRVLTGEPYTIEDPNGLAVLLPGTGFEIGLTSVATTINHAWNWRERAAERSELNL